MDMETGEIEKHVTLKGIQRENFRMVDNEMVNKIEKKIGV